MWQSASHAFIIITALLGISLALTLCLKGLNNLNVWALGGHGQRRLLLLTGIIGTPIHEISHAVIAILFGMKVDKVVLYRPDPASGSLGYVNFRYSPTWMPHSFGLFFVGVAPIIGSSILLGCASIYFNFSTDWFSKPDTQWWLSVPNMFYNALTEWSFDLKGTVLIFCGICISLHAAPSQSDLINSTKGALMSLIVLTLLLWVAGGLIDILTSVDSLLNIRYRALRACWWLLQAIGMTVCFSILGVILTIPIGIVRRFY